MPWANAHTIEIGGDRPSAHEATAVSALPATMARPFDQSARIRPRAGELIIFPGWLQHYVNPYEGDEPRISSIGFNVDTQGLSVVKQKATASLRG